MTTATSLTAKTRFTITPEGRKAIDSVPTCLCRWMVWDCWMLVCVECGTAHRVTRPSAGPVAVPKR